MAQDQDEIQSALNTAQAILNEINESIREQEGRERLKEISKNLWIGQGYDMSTNAIISLL
jgi:actin cytoskeleton-regulatory complex protein PAN1